jgi:electron transfer flavoprotein beta subunit
MRFIVCIKQVPDVSAPMQVRDGHLVMDAGRVVLNAYDASAVEAALVLVEADGGEVEVVLAGPERAGETVRKALAMGADTGTHLVLPEGTELDSVAAASLLADYLRGATYDIVLTGKQSQDTDAGLAGSMLAERLGLPYVTNAVGLAREGDSLVVTRQGDAGQEIIALPTPALVTCSNDMNDPRIPSLKGIMASKKKPVDVRRIDAPPAPAVRTLGFQAVPQRASGRRLEGEPAEVAGTLVGLLRSEARAL